MPARKMGMQPGRKNSLIKLSVSPTLSSSVEENDKTNEYKDVPPVKFEQDAMNLTEFTENGSKNLDPLEDLQSENGANHELQDLIDANLIE